MIDENASTYDLMKQTFFPFRCFPWSLLPGRWLRSLLSRKNC